ncbi:four helix bundle protein [Candidatus Uabimicrobium sp. HlEnr_7]|uniref:four helix bundle protein n=1 Tax=Candidatus Uabimicrobium helgolandensis TaxID=3095367 RepID=UPI003556D32E
MTALYQLDRASTSIVLNIAEENGKYTPKDRYFDIARGSALESCWRFRYNNYQRILP